MKSPYLYLLAAILVAALPLPGQAADISVHGVDFGIYRIEGSGPSREAKLVQKTDRIPLKRGTTFGVMVDIHGARDGRERMLRKITRFPAPGLKNPQTGRTRPYSETLVTVRDGDVLHGLFTFDHAWEMVPGTWSIEYWLGDEKLIGKEFTVVKP
jgi:hypothetical protein